ncbi:MAG TPA: ABC transporter permease [Terracidiphilus sp.]|jgi:putative ABC transport system permease protein|nr:ABC transporter permease [Terracidiphilus sp.]
MTTAHTSLATLAQEHAKLGKPIQWKNILHLAFESLNSSRIPFLLTAFGMVIGTASVILVVTIGLTGRRFILEQIQKIGTNEVELEYVGAGTAASKPDHNGFLTPADEKAVEAQLPNILYSSPVLEVHDRVGLNNGSTQDTLVLGVSPQYRGIRNLLVPNGRFFDSFDDADHAKCAVVTQAFARLKFGSPDAALGQELLIKGIPFTIIGVFNESVSDFGESEIAVETVLIPYSVARYFTGTDEVQQIYFSMRNMADVAGATTAIQRIVSARHNPNFIYATQDLRDVLSMAATISDTVMIILVLLAAVTLVVGGVGIMNIMLASVRARISEIGLRKAMGATAREIRLQFLSEAVLISLSGGISGCVVGLALPLAVRIFTQYELPINFWSVGVALLAASATGILFGTVPANRAARLDPTELMGYE